MKCAIFYKTDETIDILYPMPINKPKFNTEEEWLQNAIDRHIELHPEYATLDYTMEDTTILPIDRERGAWRGSKTGGLYIDEDVEKSIKLQRIENTMIVVDRELQSAIRLNLSTQADLQAQMDALIAEKNLLLGV